MFYIFLPPDFRRRESPLRFWHYEFSEENEMTTNVRHFQLITVRLKAHFAA